MSFDIISELDHEKLFDDFNSVLKQDRAKAFKKSYFISWLRKTRKDLWRSFRIKGSSNGQRDGEDKFVDMAEEILHIWINVGLLIGREEKRYFSTRNNIRNKKHYDIYELVD